jgi:Bax protein
MIKHIFYLWLLVITLNGTGMPNVYYKLKNKNMIKEYFFTYIDSLAVAQNKLILKDRAFVEDFYLKRNVVSTSSKEYKRFLRITKRYKLKTTDKLSKYLFHIDIIPNSLLLAQAAIESGWGKSRFIKDANNIFGQWTWTGEGLTPKNRDFHKKHKIKTFKSMGESVRGYMINLNLGWAYEDFRRLRAKLRKQNKKLSGLVLSKTLVNYSQKKEKYTKLLAKIIKKNNLERFDR